MFEFFRFGFFPGLFHLLYMSTLPLALFCAFGEQYLLGGIIFLLGAFHYSDHLEIAHSDSNSKPFGRGTAVFEVMKNTKIFELKSKFNYYKKNNK